MVEKINENAYFVIDTISFFGQILPYDPRVANQTIDCDSDNDILFVDDIDSPDSRHI